MKQLLIAAALAAVTSITVAQGFSPGQKLSLEQKKVQDSLRKVVNERTNEDYRAMLAALNIKSIRPGADGSNPNASNAANYDEAKANPFPQLPDPLVLKNGKQVTSADSWWKLGRPAVVEDFDREIYGRVPENMPKVNWKVISSSKDSVGNIPVIIKVINGRVDNSAYSAISVNISVQIITPAKARKKVPLIMEFDGFPQMRNSMQADGPSWEQQVLAKGWAYALLDPSSIQADNGAGLTEGIVGLMNKGKRRKPEDWGALRAWAWGADQVMDYLETEHTVDSRKVAIEGHSRYGKAALVTLAYDQRFLTGFISSSGAGGAKLYRRNAGEVVENVAGPSEYHWMAGNFIKYAGPLNWGDLPVDSHELITLCAPRPLFISGGSKGDGWADARGMFMAAAAAGPVYRLLGKKDLGTSSFPEAQTTLISGEIGFRQHEGGHTPGPNWPTFLAFASKYFEPITNH
jgi:hypothetical protein